MAKDCCRERCKEPAVSKGLCKKHYNAAYFQANKGTTALQRAQRKARRSFEAREGAELRAEKRRAYYRNNKERIARTKKFQHLTRLYGVSEVQYLALEKKQNGCCAVCKKPPKNRYGLCVDHCHASGKVRGLVCAGCNTALATLERDAAWHAAARKYLQRG